MPAVSSPDNFDPLAPAFARLRAAALLLPGVTESTSYGTPSLKLGKKSLCRVKDAATVVIMCPLEEKATLMEAAPDIYFETDHYKGWPAILVRIDAISDRELLHRLECAMRFQAPAKRAARRAS
ncbi:MmcQ/YjbR family DNA-binding protein [Mesorhizobium sp. LHD-90]|uniref:MmcQ/YjbR family DNA-binding protein n=1 Tax=Mesorhizobium sp. LHD-90 TaxID=3071414 RepID=UPI0027E0CBA2|nr:MmcQ/YjbR family DNA-binding protein [Mesorhizobium sp. LHD-90]MDQ6434647.1 MmcQ/YjbR family DNA-binding protein [Mesorhizobium sp. LHD-90]